MTNAWFIGLLPPTLLGHCSVMLEGVPPKSDATLVDQTLEATLLVTIDLRSLYTDRAKLDELPTYESTVLALAGEGNIVTLTGQAPIWLYLRVAHALHGVCKTLVYRSPAAGELTIFDHNPF